MKKLKPYWDKQTPKKPFEGANYERNQFYHTTAWRNIRESVIRRDKAICQECNTPIHLTKKPAQVDHIIPISQGGSYTDPNNLQTLCDSCHKTKTAKEICNRKQT